MNLANIASQPSVEGLVYSRRLYISLSHCSEVGLFERVVYSRGRSFRAATVPNKMFYLKVFAEFSARFGGAISKLTSETLNGLSK